MSEFLHLVLLPQKGTHTYWPKGLQYQSTDRCLVLPSSEMNRLSQARVTAQDFYDYDKCPHRVYLNRFGDPGEKLPKSEFLNLLFDNALTHEWEVVKGLHYDTPTGDSLEERAAATLALMEAGVERIHQGVLLEATESGIPDLLEKTAGQSKFGNYFYKPVDIKAGSGYEDQDNGILRMDYGMQLYHYGKLLQQVQGTFPPEAEVLNRQKHRVLYSLSQFKAAYDRVFPEVQALVVGTKSDEPALCGECSKCHWWSRCEKALIATDDVTLLADVGRSKKVALNAVGIRTIRDISTFNFSTVQLKGIGEKTAEVMQRSAASVLTNTTQVLTKPSIPDPPRKIYLDFEDDPTQELIYLCGLWIEPAIRGLNYHGLFCTDEAGEGKIWSEFQRLCEVLASEDFVVFHFSGYEKTKLTTLERKYGVADKAALEKFRSRMVDLLPIVKKSVVLPARGYGLKKIAPFVGLKYSAANAGGAQSIVWFRQYQQDPNDTNVMETFLRYNQEDCLAMKCVEEWLRSL
jgi:predicted RecB family nuclease